ncbi:MAG: RHS repeat-associated core domain-containing protein, partial [Endozoicomonadaceae bacterium]|nr:RHS repeat-associated core domain-containing protein [Endozoicomonadaceae bacterium]
TDNTGVTTYHYRNDGLLESTIHQGINGYASSTETLAYNSFHHLVSRTDSGNNKIIYTFDKQLRPLKKTYQENTGNTTQIQQLVYDHFSRVVKKVYGNGMIRILTYNPWGQVETIKDNINGKPLYTESLIYDADGNIIRLQRSDDQNHQAIMYYRYDRMNNLISMNCKGDNTLCPHDTAFSGDNLKTAPVIIQQNYKFTRLNRIADVTEKLIDTSSGQWHSLSKKISYSYANTKVPLRLTAISTQWNNQQSDTHAFVYDTTGNMIIDGEGNKISYNPFNQITQVVNTAGMISHYDYNGQGKEVKIITKKSTRQMIYQGGSLSSEIVTDTANNRHRISYPSAEIKAIDNTITDWNESNYKGDVISILKQDKASKQWNVQQHNVYSPYGMMWSYGKEEITVPVFQQTLKGFNGEITDAATGWQFLGNGNRTYNPSQRYFFSEDPAGDGYAFGSNNPIMNSDPSGNMPKWLGSMFKLTNTVFSLGMSSVHNKFIQGVGKSLLWSAMGLSLGTTVAIGMAFAAPATLAFASALKPANKGLQKASMITGSVYAGALFVAGLIAIGAGIGSAVAGLLVGELVEEGGGELLETSSELEISLNELGLGDLSDECSDEDIGVPADNGLAAGIGFHGYLLNIRPAAPVLQMYFWDDSGLSELSSSIDNADLDEPETEDDVDYQGVNIPAEHRAIFGCGNSQYLPCNHSNIVSFSEYSLHEPNAVIYLDSPIEEITRETGENAYTEILQEYSRRRYLELAHAALRPGGRLYVLIDSENANEWMQMYEQQANSVFGWFNVSRIDNMNTIQGIVEPFGDIPIDNNTYGIMLVMQKPFDA